MSGSSSVNESRRLFGDELIVATPPKNTARFSENELHDNNAPSSPTTSSSDDSNEDEAENEEERRRREEEDSLALALRMQAEEALQAHQHFMQSLNSMDLSDEDRAAMQAALEEDERDQVAEFENEEGELSYDALLRLGECIGDVRSERWAAVAQKHIDRLSLETYDAAAAKEGDAGNNHNDSDHKCLVCQHEYEDQERLRRLPCGHLFHAECVDEWLQTHDNCLYCRKCIVQDE